MLPVNDTLLAPDRLEELLQRFSRQRVVVIGDMVADEYVFGTPRRISREAPVLVLGFDRRMMVPGGATNVAANLRAVGATVTVVGVIGADSMGQELKAALEALGIGTQGLVVDAHRPTSTSTRIIGGGVQVVQQQIVRVDRIVSDSLEGSCREELLAAASDALADASGLILSDYEHGVIDPEVSTQCLEAARRRRIVSTVDAHGDLFRFQKMSLATPNQPEAEATLGRSLNDDDELRDACDELLAGMQSEGVLITRGSQGMVALDREGRYTNLPVLNHAEVRDATGAGDTVAAIATLALCAGASLAEAALMGNVAASLVVRHFGKATVAPVELSNAFRSLGQS